MLTDSCTTALAAAAHVILPKVKYDDGYGNKERLRVCPLTWPSTYCWADDGQDDSRTLWVDCDDDGWPVECVDVAVDLWGRWNGHIRGTAIVDAAHRFADPYHGTLLRDGDIQAVCYSFAPQKEVPCWEGGALVSPSCADGLIRDWLHSGCRDRTYNGGGGVNGLLPDPVAAFIGRQLEAHPRWRAKRQQVLGWYADHFGDSMKTKPGEASGHLAILDCGSPAMARLYRNALDKGPKIAHGHHYPLNEEQRAACPNAASLSDRIITLPCYPEMSAYDVGRIARRIFAA